MAFRSPRAKKARVEASFDFHLSEKIEEETADKIRDFVLSHLDENRPLRPIAIVTSGGTTVPLEKRTVRCICSYVDSSLPPPPPPPPPTPTPTPPLTPTLPPPPTLPPTPPSPPTRRRHQHQHHATHY